jgi:hypothetical protein
MRIICVNYVHFLIIQEISFMTVSLVSIQVNNHDLPYPVISPCLSDHKCDIGIYAKPAPVCSARVMIPPCQVYSPPVHKREAYTVHGALSRPLHGLQGLDSKQETRHKEEGHFQACADVQTVVKLEEVPLSHLLEQEFSGWDGRGVEGG